MASPKFATGEVTVDLAGTTYTLRPTLQAARALGRDFGGFAPLLQRIRDLDLDAYVAVIVQGAALERREAKEVPDLVWQSGMIDLLAPTTEFVMILANGGRPLGDEPKVEADASGN